MTLWGKNEAHKTPVPFNGRNTPGRCQPGAGAEQLRPGIYHCRDYRGLYRETGRLDVGYTDLVLRWFTGYVERSQPAENGFQRLFVRELVGVFERLWPCSFQHPTLREVASWLTEHSGLTFSVPDADYSDRPIPHFTHSGTGYQLLDNLGKAFGITDYIWYQLPDGGVYVGVQRKPCLLIGLLRSRMNSARARRAVIQ
jgi:hypothetical protein